MVTVQRVMGAETEFGLSQPGNPQANPMRDSARVVDAYAGPRGLKSSQSFWDFATESPLADARGFLMNSADADASQLTHLPAEAVEAEYLANVVTENGARYYVDHAHPEYSSPEVLTPRDLVLYDRAGDLVALDSVRRLAESQAPVNLYKNNTDSKARRTARMRTTSSTAPSTSTTSSPVSSRSSSPGRSSAAPAAWVWVGKGRSRATRSPRVRTSSKPRSGSRRPCAGRSSTPATNPTPTRRSTVASTSSSATPPWPSPPPSCASGRPRSSSAHRGRTGPAPRTRRPSAGPVGRQPRPQPEHPSAPDRRVEPERARDPGALLVRVRRARRRRRRHAGSSRRMAPVPHRSRERPEEPVRFDRLGGQVGAHGRLPAA